MLVHEEVLTMSKRLGLALCTRAYFCHLGHETGRRFVHSLYARKHRACIKVHVIFHSFVCLGVPGDFYQRRNGAADHTASPGHKEHDLGSGRDQVHNPFRIVWIRVSELHEMLVRH